MKCKHHFTLESSRRKSSNMSPLLTDVVIIKAMLDRKVLEGDCLSNKTHFSENNRIRISKSERVL
jgi:hypothetical protein